MKNIVIIVGLCAGLLCACADQETTQTGFLKNYGQMQPETNGTLKFKNSVAQGSYTAFMVDDAQYIQGKNGDALDAEQVSALKQAYRNALVKSFSEKYKLVTTAGAGVMRVRTAITGVSKSIAPLNYVATLALFTPVSNGGVSTESEVVDSLSGQRLSALSVHTNPDVFDGEVFGYFTQTGHAKSVLDDHALQLRKLTSN